MLHDNPPKYGPGRKGILLLVDTSGSMREAPHDTTHGNRPKYLLANEALDEIVRQTADWVKGHPDKPLNLALHTFSNKTKPVLPMGQFEATQTETAVKNIPQPEGGTAIGLALQDGWKALKSVGCERQYILCVTDGQNTDGPKPDVIARQIHQESGGKVEIHFIAFDVKSNLFDFLKEVNGHVVEAANAPQLKAEMSEIFKKRILVEQPDPADF